ncbi:MAG: DEAD/DEAH box helicase family protein [Acidobacteria bacterium]|nr:DEAD/DEAH box helicase family protein [Acidobacteriota bacterium]
MIKTLRSRQYRGIDRNGWKDIIFGDKQRVFDTEWTQERIKESKFINQVRERVGRWRQGGYVEGSITRTTRQLLNYWKNPERERKLFFCQIEALETAIYVTEVARKYNDAWIENDLRRFGEESNPGLYRLAFKMATGSGKTVVMAMLIAWHTLNKIADPQNALFSDTFLIVTPGITIRDRLRVLLPNDPQNYYQALDIVPADQREELGKAKVLITNFHAFIRRELTPAGKITKQILQTSFTETPEQMVRRVCRELGNKKNVVVINDEAHHCYRHKPDPEQEKLSGDERREVEKREEEARIWISGLEAAQSKIGLRAIYDLSATPFFLRGSGYGEGDLFPWVVSDFSLIDAIESGIVKVPRVPVSDDSMTGEQPTYRDLWLRIRENLPRKGRRTEDSIVEPKLPAELEGALQSLYSNYEKYYRKWEQNTEGRDRGLTPPVFIVVCNNTNVSNLVFRYVAGWDKALSDDSKIPVPGKLPLFSNVEGDRWRIQPNTILVDSTQLESGEAMSDEFKKFISREIEEFKDEYRARFPGRDIENVSDEDLLREVMNTVGKPGKLGEQIKCVVSVSMLTEGWDANTVTHILGVRAFGTQLLCEQVVGRGLRRMSYVPIRRTLAVNGRSVEIETFPTEYAEVYGVPFSFIPSAGSGPDPKPSPPPTRVRALEDRSGCEITFPRVIGYRYELMSKTLVAAFNEDSKLTLSTQNVPTKTENAPIVGESSIHTLDDLKQKRPQEVAFLLAKMVLEKYFQDDEGNVKLWLFPQLLEISKRWLDECVRCKDNTFPQMILLLETAHEAADKIYRAIAASEPGMKVLKPILRPYDTVGSTRYVDFETTRATYKTRPDRCHVNHVVADTQSWEQKMAQTLEGMEEVVCYVKNQGLGFMIPYTLNGDEKNYVPDFIAHVRNGREDSLNLIVEVSGEAKKEKAAKAATARTLWVPSINNHGGFGRWAYLEISDPWDAQNTIRAFLKKGL